MSYPKPHLYISECLGFSACRYNGQKVMNDFVESLQKYCTINPVCPEVAIGLGIPRDPIRIVRSEKEFKLIQPKTEIDLTDKMNSFSNTYLGNVKTVDGFLMKSVSPSCGIKGVAIYVNEGRIPEKRDGFFAEKISEYFPNIPLEDEGRLNNYHIRENYLTRIFTLARFRELPQTFGALVQFQAENKYLFMTLHSKLTTQLGQIVANAEKRSSEEVFFAYKNLLHVMLAEKLQKKRTVNTLQHIFGYFSKELNKDEKSHFLELLDSYSHGKEYLFTINQLLWSWVLRYNKTYLKQQLFFNAYPSELMNGVQYSGRMAR